jgi:hypothetical protein
VRGEEVTTSRSPQNSDEKPQHKIICTVNLNFALRRSAQAIALSKPIELSSMMKLFFLKKSLYKDLARPTTSLKDQTEAGKRSFVE